VVRVEQPGGDPMRLTSPEWYDALNAGKESVVCALPGDGDFARALLERADVILESFRPGVAARLASARTLRLRAPSTARSPASDGAAHTSNGRVTI